MGLGQAYADVLSNQERRLLLEAAQELIDTTLIDLSTSERSDWTADNWLIGMMLPPRYRLRYTAEFARRFFVCLVTVIWKLGQREPMRLSCVAEELAAHVLLQEAEALAEEQDQAIDYSSFRDTLFEDLDFEFLYDETYDGIEGTELGETMGITHLPFAEWFERFGPPASSTYTEVHPYAQQEINAASETSAE
jgi:hypothetical protein